MKTKIILMLMGLAAVAVAKVDLVTLPVRDTVQLTIYNSADMTLVRDGRSLTLVNGVNKLQFSWANTLIDPTSLELLPKKNADKIEVMDLEYPPRVRELGVWNVKSGIGGDVPVEITYLTSGLNWRAFYLATLAHDEKTMRLEGYVRVTNGSGEDYENAQTRLIVGKVHMLDQIAMLAQRQHPYGSPVSVYPRGAVEAESVSDVEAAMPPAPAMSARMMFKEVANKPKEIMKEGLSEYFLYTIEGTETIPNGWSKRMPSFDVSAIPVTNLYKFEIERYGNAVVRFLSFKNSTTHNLGQTPIPDGAIKVCRTEDAAQHLSYQGQSSFKYIPVNEEVELNLGPVVNVTVEPTLMDFKTLNYEYDRSGNVCGWEEVRSYKVEVKNTRDVPVRVEIQRNFPTTKWTLEKKGLSGQYEKVDMDTVKFALDVAAGSSNVFYYTLNTRHGTRE